ncbi:MAG: chromosomal replication initiator protein DnaA [Verrucomicrobiota bacterium]
MDSELLWNKVCHELQNLISPDAYQRWFSPITACGYESGRLTLGVDNSIYQYWIEENYLGQLKQAAELVIGQNVDVVFESTESSPSPKEDSPKTENPIPVADVQSTRHKDYRAKLKANYEFRSFVVGVNNQFAHAAALAVSESPSKVYNPLFIHGAVGLGKTHLMHAVGHHIIQRKPSAKVVYVTSEQFTNEFIDAIQHGELVKFRRRFRHAEVLLIDDVQFFSGKDRSQEEFFHTFNALFDGNKQIVLSSDAPPSDVSNLEQRLVSRFEWGLTAELQPPDIETRLAILRAKAQKIKVRLGDSVLLFIAERVKANIRRLEGALNRVAAWATLNDRKITQEQVEHLLKDFIQQEARQVITIEGIQKRVAERFDIRMTDMTSKRRPANIAVPRMVAMYLSRRLTAKSLQEIGDAFGGRDHGTVLHACKTVEGRINSDEKFRQSVDYVTTKLEGVK